jgi:hypothetical protein
MCKRKKKTEWARARKGWKMIQLCGEEHRKTWKAWGRKAS